MPKKKEREYYPPFVAYNNTYSSEEEYIDRRKSINHHGSMDTVILSTTFRYKKESVVTASINVAPFASFCGGMSIHSPWVEGRSLEDSWEGRPCFATETSFARQERINHDGIIDVNTFGVKLTSRQKVLEYGYRALANALVSYCTARGTRGVIAAGMRRESEMSLFISAMRELTFIRTAFRDESSGPPTRAYEAWRSGLVAAGVLDTSVDIEDTTVFRNRNSGNEVLWYPMIINNYYLNSSSEAHHDESYNYWVRDNGSQVTGGVREMFDGEMSRALNSCSLNVVPSPTTEIERLSEEEIRYLEESMYYVPQTAWCFG